MLTETQKRTAQAIVNIFETGKPRGDYGNVTAHRDDLGHLTYGRSQTTLASGNLHLLIKSYCEAPDARFAADLSVFLPRLASRDVSLDNDSSCHALLRAAADDPCMQYAQDGFFNRVFWEPAAISSQSLGIRTALGTTVVYDSKIHGSWNLIRDRTIHGHGRIGPQVDEPGWITAYVRERRSWLAGHSNRLLPRTVYRMDTFLRLIDNGAWDLPLPLVIRGVALTEDVLLDSGPLRASAEVLEDRVLRLSEPFMNGQDVRGLQEALRRAGFTEVEADGVFGPRTAAALKAYQQSHGLVVDGIVGPATKAHLGL